MTSIRRILASRLRLLRAINGWSQETLAERAGLHRTYISSIENEERSIGIDNIERLARAFGVSASELLLPPRV
jgi:transcriptional regulator with XRE-family HTH domain